MVIPDAIADRVEDNSLKTVIVAHWPFRFSGSRQVWHDRSGQMPIPVDRIGPRALIHIALFSEARSEIDINHPVIAAALRAAGGRAGRTEWHAVAPTVRAARVRGRGLLGSAEPGARGNFADRCHCERGTGRRSGRGVAGFLDAVHRTRRRGLVEQYGAGDGAEHLGSHVRPGGGDAVCRGCQATGAVRRIAEPSMRSDWVNPTALFAAEVHSRPRSPTTAPWPPPR